MKQFVRPCCAVAENEEQDESGAIRSNAASSALERFGIRRLNEQWNPHNDRPQGWQPLVLETECLWRRIFYDGHGEASPAKAVQAAETRLFAVEVAKRRAGMTMRSDLAALLVLAFVAVAIRGHLL